MNSIYWCHFWGAVAEDFGVKSDENYQQHLKVVTNKFRLQHQCIKLRSIPQLPFKSWNELLGVKPVGWTGVVPTLDKSIVNTELLRSPFPKFPRIWSTSVIKSSMRSIALFFHFQNEIWVIIAYMGPDCMIKSAENLCNFSLVLKINSLVI